MAPYRKDFQKSPCITCDRGSKFLVQHPILPSNLQGLLRFFNDNWASFWYLLVRYFLIKRYFWVFTADTKSARDTTKTRLNVSNFDFGCFGHFCSYSFLEQPLSLGNWFTKNKFHVCSFTCSKWFFHDFKFWINNHYNKDQVFENLYSIESILCCVMGMSRC